MGVTMATGNTSAATGTVAERFPKKFGEVLREFRKENNISISSLSETSGVTGSALFRIEIKDPNRTPNRSTIASLFLSLSFLSGKNLEEVYRYFLERISDPKQVRQIEKGKEVALKLVKISKEAETAVRESESEEVTVFGGGK